MSRSILPQHILSLWDNYQIAAAYLKKLNPKSNFVGGFNMMLIAGVFNKKVEDEEPNWDVIKLLDDTVEILSTQLQLGIYKFLTEEVTGITTDYELINLPSPDRTFKDYPSLVISDNTLRNILSALTPDGIYSNFTVNCYSEKVFLSFDKRIDLIRYAKERNIIVRAFGKQWQL